MPSQGAEKHVRALRARKKTRPQEEPDLQPKPHLLKFQPPLTSPHWDRDHVFKTWPFLSTLKPTFKKQSIVEVPLRDHNLWLHVPNVSKLLFHVLC